MNDVVSPPQVAPLALLNRERAILAFNRRVLAQARRADVPALERLRYVCIVSSNLDEFFEVRFADYLEAARRSGTGVSLPDVQAVAADAHALIDDQYAAFNDDVMPALQQHGIVIVNHASRNEAQRRWVSQFFQQQVRPLMVPIGLDPAHPFPQVANKSLNFIARLGGKDAFGRENSIAIVKVPRALPRVLKLPDELGGGRQVFVQLTSVIRAHLAELFPGREVEVFSQFRITRDSDLEVDEDDVTNLRQALRSGLTTRHFGQAIRLEVVATCPAELYEFLLRQFNLPESALYRVNGPVNLVRLTELIDLAHEQPGGAALRFAPFEPAWPAGLTREEPIIESLRRHDVLLHHPFESFEPVVQFLREAVLDPDVLAIKQTIYRTGSESPLMDLLIEAARRGKEVLVVVELKARFDEEANINWAERLEAVGVQVVYGIVGLKTHAKLMLITRREGAKLRRYLHLSTGNYNPKSARLYTDLGYMTADGDLTADADAVFRQLASLGRTRPLKRLLQAPFTLHRQMLAHIAQVRDAAAAGRPARIVVKINALTDVGMIGALVDAGRAGADIDLIVRGACMLPPGVAGVSERIRVRSIVGRFLEHSRIIYFRWGAAPDDEAMYLSSADWMGRNMFGRIEIAWSVRDAALRQRVIDECLVPYLHDRRDAWQLLADGRYERLADDGISAQQALLAKYRGTPELPLAPAGDPRRISRSA
ncbi:MAG: polyphosphate kinase 1 [Proteobacteria bacterium]|nr:polyphosphate kinase 1 [Pseudomonadota bacterium]